MQFSLLTLKMISFGPIQHWSYREAINSWASPSAWGAHRNRRLMRQQRMRCCTHLRAGVMRFKMAISIRLHAQRRTAAPAGRGCRRRPTRCADADLPPAEWPWGVAAGGSLGAWRKTPAQRPVGTVRGTPSPRPCATASVASVGRMRGVLPRAPARRSSAAPVRARGAASPPVSSSGCTAVATAGLAAWRVRRPPRGAASGVESACAGGAARAVTSWGATRGGGWRAAARPAAPRRRRGGWLPAGPRERGRRGRARVGVGADPDGRRGPHRPVAAVDNAGGRPTSCGTRSRAAAGRRVWWASVAALRRWLPRPPVLRAAGRAPPTSDAATAPPFKGAAPAAGGGPWGGCAAATRSRGGRGCSTPRRPWIVSLLRGSGA